MREEIAQITYDGMAWGSHLLQADEILALIIKEIDAVENPHGEYKIKRGFFSETMPNSDYYIWEQAKQAILERFNG